MSTHTIQEMRAVMAETQRLLDRDAGKKTPPTISATAKAPEARPAPAAKASAPAAKAKGFWDYVAEAMGAGKSKRQAVATAAKEHPDLHQEMLREFNAQARDRQERDRGRAADARNSLRRLSARR